jgi:heme/copper-type cytochrome/quinol oxidase subunit 1
MIYLVRGLLRGVIGFQLSYIMRMSLKYRGIPLLGNHVLYQSLLTAHAFVMIFFSIIPILIGRMGNLLVPLIVCKRDIDLPRFNSYSF